ncbi:cyclic lactone autoinducer peptide [Paenibacillus sp. GYB003]
MDKKVAKILSSVLNGIARYFLQTASPFGTHRPQLPEELK